ncbi:MAG: hypothetical protein ABIR57_00855 [Aeromicrobium sp.]
MTNLPTANRSGTSIQVHKLMWPTAVGALVLTISFMAIGTFANLPEDADAAFSAEQFVTRSGIVLAAVVLVFALVLPWALRRGSTGLIALSLSLIGMIFVFGYWTGLSPAFAAGGALLGWVGLDAAKGRGLSQAAFVIGLLAVISFSAIYVVSLMGK